MTNIIKLRQKETALQPDSQTVPFGPNQLEWIDDKYGSGNFRAPQEGPIFKPMERK